MASDNTRGMLLMTLAMALFMINDSMIKAAMERIPMFQAIALRGLIVTLLLIALGLYLGGLRPRLNKRERKLLLGRTACELGATVTALTALSHMPLANLSAIWQLLPLAMTLGAALFFKEVLGWQRLLAICIGFGGVMLVIKPGSEAFNIWSLAGFASVFLVCGRDLMTRGLSGQVSAIYVALIAAAATMLMGLIGSLFAPWAALTWQVMAYLICASFTLMGGLILIVSATRIGDISAVSPFRYTSLLWAIALGYLIFGDLPDSWAFLGCALVVGSGLYSLWRESRGRNLRFLAKQSS